MSESELLRVLRVGLSLPINLAGIQPGLYLEPNRI